MTTGLRAVLAAALVLGAIACSEERGDLSLSIELSPGALALTAEQGVSRTATIVATAAGEHPQLHLRARSEGDGLAAVETASFETYALVTIRSSPELAPGTYRGTLVVTACLDEACREPVAGPPLRVPFAVTVLEAIVSPSSLVLSDGGDLPAEAEVSVTLPPGVTEFGVSLFRGSGWLLFSGRTATHFRVLCAAERRGTYEGALRVTIGEEVRLVQVRCTKPPRPLVVDPKALGLWAPSGSSTGSGVSVSLPDDASHFTVQVRAAGWLTANPMASGADVVASPMPPGRHEGSLTFTAGDSTVAVPVRYWVNDPAPAGGELLAAPSTMTFSTEPGQEMEADYLRITPPAGVDTTEATVEYGPGPRDWLVLTAMGPGYLVEAYAGSLSPGSYTAEVVVAAGTEVPVVRVPVALTVGPGLVRPPDRRHVLAAASTPQDLRGGAIIETLGVAPGLRWRATSDTPWLVLDEPAGMANEALVYSIDPARAPPGIEGVATVTVTADPAIVPAMTFQIRLSRRLGAIRYVTPPVQPADRTSRVLLCGNGFALHDPALPVYVDGVGPVPTTYLSDLQIEVQLPPLPVGRHTIRLARDIEAPGTSAAVDVYSAGALDYGLFPHAGRKNGLTYDPIRSALFVADVDHGVLLRYALKGSTLAQRSIPGLGDIGLTPDRTTLLATTATHVLSVDPDTLEDRAPSAAPNGGFAVSAPSAGIPIMTNGIAWFTVGASDFPSLIPFDFVHRVFGRGPPFRLEQVPFFSTTRDRQRLLLGQPRTLPNPGIRLFDLADGTFRSAPIDASFFTASQSDDGGRVILDGSVVYDRSFAFIGSTAVPPPYRTREPSEHGYGAVLSPDGSRAYVLAYTPDPSTPARLYVFDTSRVPPSGVELPILGSRDLAELPSWFERSSVPPTALLAVSPDDATLFVATNEAVLVLPVAALFEAPPAP